MPELLPYGLTIASELTPFRSEIEYACDFLDRAHFVRRVERAERMLHYGPNAPPGSLTVPAALFPNGVRINADGIHPNEECLAALENDTQAERLLPPTGNAISPDRLEYDALGLIFHQLSRLEERDSPRADRYGRYPIDEALANRAGSLLDPLADGAACDLARALTGEREPASRTSYEVLFTHDVDRLRGYHRWHEPLRYALGDTLKRLQPAAALRRLQDAHFGGHPWRSARRLMAMAEASGLQSRFYFMGPSNLSMDSPYALTMKSLLRRLVEEIVSRGHLIGFHPGYGTHNNSHAWLEQKNGLEAVVGRQVTEGRQHVLCYSAADTPDIWDDADMALDCTLAFPEAPAFRAGTCRRFQAYSLRRRKALNVEQLSTAITDFGLLSEKYQGFSVERALIEAAKPVAVCRRYGGSLALLYHCGDNAPKPAQLFQRLLGELV